MKIKRQGKSLIPSEIDLISRLESGKSVRAIATDTGRTAQTVSAQVRRLMLIAGAKNHFQLGVWARDNGYLSAVNVEKTTFTPCSNLESIHA